MNPSRFLAFREKQRVVEAEYGFRLGVPCRTAEQREGHARYMRDWQKRYRDAHREERTTYLNAWHKKRRDERRAQREAKRAEREAAKNASRAAWEEKCRRVKEKYGFDLGHVPIEMSPEEAEARKRYQLDRDREYRAAHRERRLEILKACKERKRRKIERRKRRLASLEKAREKQRELKRLREAEAKAARERELAAKREAFAAKQKAVFEKYGFVLGRTPTTPEEIAGHERYVADRDRAYQAAHRELYRQQDKERRRRKAEKRKHLAALNAERSAKAKEERRQVKIAKQLEARQEREAAAAVLAEAEKTAVAGFAAEREANREAYLAAKAAKRDEGWRMRDEKQSPVPSVSPVTPVPEVPPVFDVPPTPAINIAEYLPHHPFRGLLLEDTAPTDEEVAGDAVTPGYGYYTADDSSPSPISHSPSLSSGGKPPQVPPSVATGGEPPEDDDDDWRRREREEKIRHVREQYGFTLGVKPVTPEEIEGKKRYIADRNREREILNREIDFMLHGKERARKAAAKKRKATIARKKREAAAQAAREAKEAVREAQRKACEEARQAAREAKRAAIEAEAAAKAERKALLEQAYSTFKYKVTAYERKKAKMRRQLGLPKKKSDFTPEQREHWNTYLHESRADLENWLVERMRKVVAKEVAKAAKAKKAIEAANPTTAKRRGHPPLPAEVIAARDARIKEREERKRLIFEKYGFTLGRKPKTPEEIEGRKRYDRDMLAAERERNREKIRAYQRAYGKIRAARRLAEAQAKWSPEQWADWEKRQAAKERGTPQWLMREVVKQIATAQNLPEDAVMERVIDLDGLDFLIKGAESMGAQRCAKNRTIPAAARALAFYLDPDRAAMFVEREEGKGKREKKG